MTIIIIIATLIALTSIYIYIKQPVRYITGDEFVFATPKYNLLSPGEEIIIVETKEYNMFTPIKRAIKPQVTYNAEIIAGPYGKIKKTEETNRYEVTHGKLKRTVYLENLNQEYLEEEYIVRPIDNYGNAGTQDKLVSKKEILGLRIKENN